MCSDLHTASRTGQQPRCKQQALCAAIGLPISALRCIHALQGPALHGVRGLVNLFGIGSPGLTSSLAIAEHVAKLLGR